MPRPLRKAAPLGLVLDAASPTPLHRQIGEQVRRAILERRQAPGQRLPSSRLMASELEVARGTVLLAMDQLIAEGYVVAQAASGLSVANDLPDEMLATPRAQPAGAPANDAAGTSALSRRARTALRDAMPSFGFEEAPLAFPTGQPDREAFPFALWARLLEREWRRPSWAVASALHPFGHAGLRAAIADYLGAARGFACTPQSIVVTTGVRQSLSLLAWLALDPDDAAWIEEPGFVGTRQALALAGARAVPVAIDEQGFAVERALAAEPEAKLAVVAPAHHFPLGTVLGLQRRLELLSWAERRKGWIAEDDYDGEYRYAGRPLAPLRALDRSGRVAYLASFSKLLFPALRLSYVVLPEALVPAAEKPMMAEPTRPSLLGQGALARFIADGHFATYLRRTRLLYAARQEALLAGLERHLARWLESERDPGGMHLIARPVATIAPAFDDRAVCVAAAHAGLTLSPLSACYAGRRRRHGLIMGYAGTPEQAIEPACAIFARVLGAATNR
ncbi:GntR family transcriptional regulator / MocR family aminotransferase [Rhodospirillales bacterium URHD0017]|nr:GntR family transcriptional regulator / MocR family aminotransferase [Rhodospirillales bacterium URHD0017]